MLPDPALATLIEYIDNTRTSVFISLAQVNRASRRFFLSDYAWKRFDAHQVHGKHNVYTYGDYKHEGIAAHYYNWLCTMPACRRRWHLPFSESYACKVGIQWYDQLDFLTRTAELFNTCKETSVVRCLLNIDDQVWRCWLLHPLPDECDWHVKLRYLYPLFKDKARYTKIACCVYLGNAYTRDIKAYHNSYQDDREVNMRLIQRGQWRITAEQFKQDEDFMLEAMCQSSKSGSHLIYYGMPNLLNRLYELNFDMAVTYATKCTNGIQTLSKELINSEKFMRECIKYRPQCISKAGKLCENVAVISAAIENDPWALGCAGCLRDNKDIVLLALSKDPRTLGCASRRLRDDVDLVKSCTDRDPSLMKYASTRARLHLKWEAWFKRRS